MKGVGGIGPSLGHKNLTESLKVAAECGGDS